MKLGDYEFEYVCDIEPVRLTDGSLRQHLPQERYKNARNLPLNKYGAGPFCKFAIPSRFKVSGVYVFTVDGAPQYVGECANLSARFNAAMETSLRRIASRAARRPTALWIICSMPRF